MTKLDNPVCRILLPVGASIVAGNLGSLVKAVAKEMEQPFANGKSNISGSGLVRFLPKDNRLSLRMSRLGTTGVTR